MKNLLTLFAWIAGTYAVWYGCGWLLDQTDLKDNHDDLDKTS